MRPAVPRRTTTAAALGLLLAALPASGQEHRLLTIRPGAIEAARSTTLRLPIRLSRPAGLRSRPALAKAGSLAGPALPDTVRVLVLRVAFQPDDDSQTTGTGVFDLRDLDTFRAQEGHDIDAAPHDRAYIERHMTALQHYWWANSNGALDLVSTVLPQARDEALQLPRPMAYYGFESPLGDILVAFQALVSDAVTAAEEGADAVAWDTWDAFVIVHAGSDWQGDAAGAGDTPADIPSAYIALDEPIEVGGRSIWDATVMPETVTQDGFVGGVNGVFAHEFAHQLGLPDLYDTVGGETAVGLFALMDLGDFTGGTVDGLFVQGVLPAGLSPWTKLYMGWLEPVEVAPGDPLDLTLIAAGAVDGIHAHPPGPRMAMIHAAEHQAFLVEYRPDDLDGDTTVSLNWNQGVIDGTARLVGGVKELTYEYDALLPGSGVLIWHLDEEVARNDADGDGFDDLYSNTLQTDRYRRFLDVEEADGRQSLGFLPGYLGDAGDYWRPGASAPGTVSRFTPAGDPDSGSWSGASTGITVEVLDHPDPLSVRIRVSATTDTRWVVPVPATDPGLSVPWWVDPAVGDDRVVMLDGDGGLHLWDDQGVPVGGPGPVWTSPAPPLFPPTASGGRLAVVTAGDLFVLGLTDGSPVGSLPLSAEPLRRPLDGGGSGGDFLVTTADGGLLLTDGTATIASTTLSHPPEALARLGPGSFLLLADGVFQHIVSQGGELLIEIVGGAYAGVSDMAVVVGSALPGQQRWTAALLGDDGRLRFVHLDQDGALPLPELLRSHALTGATGTLALGKLDLLTGTTSFALPTADGIMAFDEEGQPLSDWPPRRLGRAVAPTPAPRGSLLMPEQGVVIGLDGAGAVDAWGEGALAIGGARRQLPRDPVAPLTLGSVDGAPVLLSVETDSLRVIGLPWWEVSGPGSHFGRSPWPGPLGGATAVASFPGLSWVTEPDLPASSERFYTYPNPAGESCWIRAEGLAGTMVVRAFTMGGSPLGEVARLDGDHTRTVTREAIWDVSDLAPGAYLLVGTVDGSVRVTAKVLVVR